MVFATVSEQKQGVDPSNRPLTEEEWADSIRSDVTAGTTDYISAGRKLLAAKKELKKHGGSFISLVEVKLGWNLDTAEKWMAIAGNPVLADSATLRNLPTSWTTLYALSRLPPEVLERCIKNGTIHPQLTCKAATALANKVRLSNLDSAFSTETGVSTETPASAGADQKMHDVPTVSGSDIPTDQAVRASQEEEIGPNSRGEIERKLARLEELEREKAQWEIRRHGYEREIEELKAQLGAETAPSCGLIWKGDDENGWHTKIENRYYSVTRHMRQGRGRGKIRNPDYFIYTASCLDIRSLEGNPKLISWCGERILPPNLPDPDPIYAGMPKIPRTADEAKALCEEAERLNRLPAAIAKPASDVAPPARDGLDIPEYLRRTAP